RRPALQSPPAKDPTLPASSTAASNRLRARFFVAAAAAWFLAPASAHAQAPSDPALAESLFQEAKALLADGRLAEACPKFEESQRLDPGTGTLMALALCHEGEGKSASAWAEFTQVAAASEKDKRADRVRVARDHIHKLESSLSRLTIVVAQDTARLPGLEVTRDGLVIRSAAWGTPLPIDPGEHTIVAVAAGKARWTKTVTVGAGADRRPVPFASLDAALAAAPPPGPVAPRAQDEPAPSGRRTAGFVVGGVGIASVAVGGVFGVRAILLS